MLKYNLTIALRNLLRNKGFSFINIIGLSLGMACSFFLLLTVYEAYKTDTFHTNFDNIFLIQQKVELESGTYTADRVGGAMGPALINVYPQIKEFVRIGRASDVLLSYFNDVADKRPFSVVENEGLAVDSTFLKIFSFEMIKGNPEFALNNENFIVLTETLSKTIFKNEDPIGKILKFNEHIDLIVTGIIEDVPRSSSIQFTYIVPFRVMESFSVPIDSYGGTNFFTYFLLDNPGSSEIINSDINSFLDGFHEEEHLETNRFLTHIRKAYFYGESQNYLGLYIIGIIGFGILLIACINYINLTTAKSTERAREVGIRKTGGAGRFQLIRQFMGESLILSVIAIHLAILIIEIALPTLNQLFDTELRINLLDPVVWGMILLIILFTGILSGFYPSFMLSSMKPVTIMREYQSSGRKGQKLRKFLVILQFSLTLFFIVCTLFMYRQFVYMESTETGFDKKNLIYIPTRGDAWEKYNEIKNELLLESGIRNVTTASELPNMVDMGDINWGKESEEHNMVARILFAGEDALKTFGVNLVAGNFYSADTQLENEEGIIVSEEIIKILGYEEDPIGRRFRLWDMDKKIIGVVEDYNFFPYKIASNGLIISYTPVEKFIFLKTESNFSSSQLARVQEIFLKFNPNYPLEYFFMEDFQYPHTQATNKLIQMLLYLCIFGVFISCLGLFGLALYTTQRRSKEIGIRKAFGATVPTIVRILSKEFITLVFIACVISIPLALLAMKSFLSIFTLKVELNVWIIVFIAFVTILIAFATVFWQSLTAARQNPVTSLRYE